MSNIVFLTGTYFDRPSANGICVKNIVTQLQIIGHDIDVICCETVDQEEYKIPDNIHFVSATQQVDYSRLQILHRKTKSLCRLVLGVNTPDLSTEMVCNYIEALKEIASRKELDVIVAAFFPLESLEAVFQYKKENPTVKFLVLEFDSVFDGVGQKNSHFPLYKYMHNKWQSKIYDSANAIFLMKSHEDYWKKEFGNVFIDKLKIVDIPVLSGGHLNNMVESNSIKMIYAGLIERKYRSPSYLLNVLKGMATDCEFKFDFYSKGDCESEIADAAKIVLGISQKGYVSQDELERNMLSADFFVSIGNSVSRSVPSKLISYFSYGKPIIHFASQKDDVCIEYLMKYPLSLIVDQSVPAIESSKAVVSFVQETKGKTVDYETIQKIYYMNDPAYSANLICDFCSQK